MFVARNRRLQIKEMEAAPRFSQLLTVGPRTAFLNLACLSVIAKKLSGENSPCLIVLLEINKISPVQQHGTGQAHGETHSLPPAWAEPQLKANCRVCWELENAQEGAHRPGQKPTAETSNLFS